MKNKFILSIFIIYILFITLSCKEQDEWGIKDMVSTVLLEMPFSSECNLYIFSDQIEGIQECYFGKALEEDIDFKEIFTIQNNYSNYTEIYLGSLFPTTRRNIDIEFLLEIKKNNIIKKYKGFLSIDYIKEDNSSLYCSYENFIFKNEIDSDEIINANFIYGLKRTI